MQYKLIRPTEVDSDQLVQLLSYTGYFTATAKGNLLNLSPKHYIREFIVKPFIPITTVIVEQEKNDNVIGMICCASKKELDQISMPKSYVNPKLKELFESLHKFEIEDSYNIQSISIHKAFRNNGLGSKLMQFAELKAKNAGCEKLSLLVWSCQTNAIKFYLKRGFQITKSITVSEDIPFSLLLYLEKNFNDIHNENYFETEEYNKLDLLRIIDEKK